MNSSIEPDNKVHSQYGGVNVDAGANVTAGGDVTAGDKYVFNQTIIVQNEAQARLLLGKWQKLKNDIKEQGDVLSHKKRPEPRSKIDYRRKMIYTLSSKEGDGHISDSLRQWRFVHYFARQPLNEMPLAEISNKVVGIGDIDGTTFDSPPIPEMSNCSAECELRILDDGGDPERWAGIRVRGFLDDIQFGYLVYLRGKGTVELYRAQKVIGGENKIVVPDTKNAWTKLRLDVLNSKLKVWVNGKLHINTRDKNFCDKGLVYLHTFGTRIQFRNFGIYRLLRQR